MPRDLLLSGETPLLLPEARAMSEEGGCALIGLCGSCAFEQARQPSDNKKRAGGWHGRTASKLVGGMAVEKTRAQEPAVLL